MEEPIVIYLAMGSFFYFYKNIDLYNFFVMNHSDQ